MGFFQDLKEDLSQAVNELVPDEHSVELADYESKSIDEDALFAAAEEAMGIEKASDIETMIAASEEMDKEEYVTPLATLPSIDDLIPNESEETVSPTPFFEPAPEMAEEEEPVEEAVEEPAEEPWPVAEPEPVFEPVPDPVYSPVVDPSMYEPEPVVTDEYVSNEVATITKMMTVNGDIVSSGSLDITGAVNGNIDIKGAINVSGSIKGNTVAAEIVCQNARIDGDLTSTGAIKIGSNTVIRGNVYATSAVIAGAVKGDIDVHGPVILDSSAIVMGDIKSKTVQINIGAAIDGRCSQCYAEVSPKNFFND